MPLLTGLYDGLVNAVVERQVPHDAHDVPLDLQGVPAELVDPLQELQTPVGHDVGAVTLDLEISSVNGFGPRRQFKNTPQRIDTIVGIYFANSKPCLEWLLGMFFVFFYFFVLVLLYSCCGLSSGQIVL